MWKGLKAVTGCRKVLRMGMLFILLLNIYPAAAAGSEVKASFEIEPALITQGPFYHGQEVKIRALVPAGNYSLAVRCLGPAQDLDLMVKGRVMGLWMNVKEIQLKGFPSLYFFWADKPLKDIAAAKVQSDYTLGYDALRSEWMKQQTDPSEEAKFSHFLKLKEEDKLYQTIPPSSGHFTRRADGYLEMALQLWIPAKATPGQYKVTMVCLENGLPACVEERIIDVTRVGWSAFITKAAQERGLAFGIAAAIVATISGLLVGLLFSVRRGH